MAAVLYVRATSRLDGAELDRRLLENRPYLLDVPGLLQRVCGRDEDSGDLCGIYLFESREALEAFLQTDLLMNIAVACEAAVLRPEVYEVLDPLRAEMGPIAV